MVLPLFKIYLDLYNFSFCIILDNPLTVTGALPPPALKHGGSDVISIKLTLITNINLSVLLDKPMYY